MFRNSSLAIFLLLGPYLLYYPGMRPEMVACLLYCIFVGLMALGLELFGDHPLVKRWLDCLF